MEYEGIEKGGNSLSFFFKKGENPIKVCIGEFIWELPSYLV